MTADAPAQGLGSQGARQSSAARKARMPSPKQQAVSAVSLAAASPRCTARPAQSRLTVAQYQSASAGAIQAEVQIVQDALCSCQAAYNKALADVNRGAAKIQQLQDHVK